MHSRYLALLLCATAFYAHATPSNTSEAEPFKKNYLAAVSTAEASNLLLYLNNRYIGSSDFADVSPQSIGDNIRSQWQWDQSVFSINEFGHPYQGSFYFTSGRANGLNFYESAALTMMGSATWEITCERSTPSLNDLITTTTGGMAFGEIFHRLYLEAKADGNPVVAAIVSPTDALTDALNGRKPKANGGNIETLLLTNGAGGAISWAENPNRNVKSSPKMTVYHGLSLVYGIPYAHTTTTPYTHFNMDVDLFFGPGLTQLAYFTDGYLISATLQDNAQTKATAGLTLNYDVILGNTNTFGTTALDLAVKSIHFYGEKTRSSLAVQAGWLMLGSSQYYHPESTTAFDYEELNNYGTGLHSKLSFAVEHELIGKTEINAVFYHMWIIPNTAPESEGTVSVARSKIAWSHPITPRTSFGISNTATWNFSHYEQLPNNTKYSNATTLYFQSDMTQPSHAKEVISTYRERLNEALKKLRYGFKDKK